MTATCRSCGAEIVWAVTEKGKRMPLDAQPQRLFVLQPIEPDAPLARSELAYTSHFATCPNADQHRRSA